MVQFDWFVAALSARLNVSPRHLFPTYPGRYMSSFTLKQHEITVNQIHRNLPPSALYEHAILHEKDAHIAENGALVAYSGAAYEVTARKLAGLFTTNFAAYEEGASAEVKAAGPMA